jgi:hypothetical protein
MPVVGMNDIRGEIEQLAEFQAGPGEEDEAVVVVNETLAVGAVNVVAAVKGFMFKEVDRNVGVGHAPFVDAAVHGSDDPHGDHEWAGEELQAEFLAIDPVIPGEDYPNVVAQVPESAGKGSGDIAKPPFLHIGCCFGNGKEDGKGLSHEISCPLAILNQ